MRRLILQIFILFSALFFGVIGEELLSISAFGKVGENTNKAPKEISIEQLNFYATELTGRIEDIDGPPLTEGHRQIA